MRGDFMSRYYAPKTKAAVHIVSSYDGKKPIDINNLQEVQQENEDIQETIKAIAEGKDILRAPYNRMKQHLFVSQGAFYVRHNHNMRAIILPEAADQLIIQSHLDPLHSHIGADKLEHRLRQYVYIQHIHEKVKEIVNECGICIQTALLHTTE